MSDPLFINVDAVSGEPEYNAREFRRGLATLLYPHPNDLGFGAREGVRPTFGDTVTLSGTLWTVRDTCAVVYPGLTSQAGPYIVQFPSESGSLDPADGSSDRIDALDMQVQDDDEDSSGQRRARVVYVVGTPAPSPVEPPLTATSMRLATFFVPAGGLSPSVTNVAPYTVAAGGVLPVRDEDELPPAGRYVGEMAYRQDTSELRVVDVGSDPSGWERLVGLGDHEAVFGAGGSSTDIDLSASDQTLSTATVTVPGHWSSWRAEVHATVEVINEGAFGGSATADRQMNLTADDGSSQIGFVWSHSVRADKPNDTIGALFTNPSGSSATGTLQFRLRASLSTDDGYSVNASSISVTLHRF